MLASLARVGLVLALTWLAVASSASAQDRASQRAYQRTITEAVAEFDDGHWEEARALFEQAHALSPSARTLRGMGMCAFELRRYDAAITLFESALADERRPLTRRQRTEVEDLARRARTFLGRFRVTLSPPGVMLSIDDAPATLGEDGTVVLSVGVHTLEASLEGHTSEVRRLEVHGEEDLALEFTLSPVAPAQVVITSTTPTEAVAALLAAGGALLVEAWAIGWFVDRQHELDVCAAAPVGFACENRAPLVDLRDAALATTIGAAIATLALASSGALLWLLHESGGAAGEAGSTARLACTLGPLGLGCAGTF